MNNDHIALLRQQLARDEHTHLDLVQISVLAKELLASWDAALELGMAALSAYGVFAVKPVAEVDDWKDCAKPIEPRCT